MTVSRTSSRSEAVRKLRYELLEQQRVQADQQEQRERVREERERMRVEDTGRKSTYDSNNECTVVGSFTTDEG